MLAMHPEVQDKVYEEVKNTLKDATVFSLEMVNEMRYLDQVFKEILRLFPVAGFTIRVTSDFLELGNLPKITKKNLKTNK